MPTPFSSGQAEHDYIVARARELGLDPEAVLAVAAHEGISLPARVGDSGTSFGPWQLHAGGRLPSGIAQQGSGYANEWANSQEGIDYALEGIASLARGQTGPAAVRTIVYSFEQPQAPGPEATAALATYTAGGGPSVAGSSSGAQQGAGGVAIVDPRTGEPSGLYTPPTGPQPTVPTHGGNLLPDVGPINSLEKFLAFITSWRFAELVGGALLLAIGLVLLGRQFGVNAGPGFVKSAASTTEGGVPDAFRGAPGPAPSDSYTPSETRRASRRRSVYLPGDEPRRVRSNAGPGDTIPY